ncbi:MAG: branched-chain amino acid aminotransferase, group [Chlorobi bacterium]|nr:branched-chain amino acid aminotransferase, group [Chlorobiota bacterium]
MDDFIYLNGEIIRADLATISPFDRGFLYGDGLFETMRSYDGRVHLLRRHLERLHESAAFLGIPLPSAGELTSAIEQTMLANGARDSALRLTVTRGVGGSAFDTDIERRPTVMITTRALPGRSVTAGENIIMLSAVHRPPPLGKRVKSLDYTIAANCAAAMRAAGAREGILLTDDRMVASGSVSNIFIISDGIIITPPLSLGILPGITRGRVLELAAGCSLEVREELFDRDALLDADECFYANSLREIVPVASIDGCAIRGAGAGYAEMLMERYRAETPDELL